MVGFFSFSGRWHRLSQACTQPVRPAAQAAPDTCGNGSRRYPCLTFSAYVFMQAGRVRRTGCHRRIAEIA
jgi:hypothetical protein